MIQLAVFASGNGSNAINLINYFTNHPKIRVSAIYCNNPHAGIILKAKDLGVPCILFTKEEWKNGLIVEALRHTDVDFVILAGFLWLIPSDLITDYPNKIINIHPSLLPNYGGKGMFGMNVHNRVIEEKQTVSGITIHLVNEEYDKGQILFQEKLPVFEKDTAIDLANKIHQLEYKHFPKEVEKYIASFEK